MFLSNPFAPGKFFKEKAGKVYIPYGEEYVLYVKNLHSERAVVKFDIDGKDPWDERFVIKPNETIEVKGDRANKAFKFIKKTQKISDHRGDRIDDGILRIEFQFEKALPEIKTVITQTEHHHYDHYHPTYYPHYRPIWWGRRLGDYYCGGFGSSVGRGSAIGVNNLSAINTNTSGYASTGTFTASNSGDVTFTANAGSVNCSANAGISSGEVHDGCATMDSGDGVVMAAASAPMNWESLERGSESGITVAGQNVQQDFHYVNTRELETTVHSIVLELYGLTETEKPVTLQDHSRAKKKCPTCGNMNKPLDNFCSECGTNIQ